MQEKEALLNTQNAALRKENDKLRDELKNINPYFFRDKASRTELPLMQTGRALYHLAQRRGFLSNRLDQGSDGFTEQIRLDLIKKIECETDKTELLTSVQSIIDTYSEEEDKDAKKLLKGVEKLCKINNELPITEFKEKLINYLNKADNLGAVKKGIADVSKKITETGCETLGQYFYKLYQNQSKIRKVYTARTEHYYHEFLKICETQNICDQLKHKLDKAIFYQRPLKSQKGLIGKCVFEKNKTRCAVSHPAYEEYRALQFINSIKVSETKDGKKDFLSFDERKKIWPKCIRKSKPNFDFKEIAETLDKKGLSRYYNYTGHTSVSGCPTIAQLTNIFGENWQETLFEKYTNKQNTKGLKTIDEVVTDIWHVLFTFDKDEKIIEFGKQKLGLNEVLAKKFGAINLKKDYASLSLKAINKILPYLREGLIYSYAVFLANIENVVGEEIWKNDENKNLIKKELHLLIDNFNEIKGLEAVVNDFIADFKKEYNNAHKDYVLDEQDKKILLEKIESNYGKNKFESLEPDKKTEIINSTEKMVAEQLRKQRGEFIKPKRLDEKISEFLINNFNVTKKSIARLYHPSDVEIFKTASRNSEGLLLLGSPIVSSIKNPMAMRAMHQLRKLVNTLIKENIIDEETKINIELARELNDANKRAAIKKWQDERQKAREEYKKSIKELFKAECGKDIEPSDSEILKYELWEEQQHICIYTGKTINICDFIGANPNFDIEHTIPKSLCFDNSNENLTLCDIQYNRDVKRNKIPTELSDYNSIKPRLDKWLVFIDDYEKLYNTRKKAKGIETKEQKDKRIKEKHYYKLHLDYWKGKYKRFIMVDVPSGFKNSQIVDTGIITKYAISYMKSIFPKVYSVKGNIVAEFRKIWGLQNDYEKKERVNHVHHCIDAITIACMSKQKYDTLAKIYHEDEAGFHKIKKETQLVSKPWTSFTMDVLNIEKEIFVSHHTPDNMKKQSKKVVRERGIIAPKVIYETDANNNTLRDKYGKKIVKEYILLKDVNGNLIPIKGKRLTPSDIINKVDGIDYFSLIINDKIQYYEFAKSKKTGKIIYKKEPIYLQGDTVRGSLHLDTFYGAIAKDINGNIITNTNGKIAPNYVIRKELSKLKETDIENIVDPVVRGKIIEAKKNKLITFNKSGAVIKTTIWMKENQIPINKVRVYSSLKNPLPDFKKHRDLSHLTYKQQYNVSNEENYCLAIYEGKNKKGNVCRTCELVNMIDAGNYYRLSNKNWKQQYPIVPEKDSVTNYSLKTIITKGLMVLLYEKSPEEIWELTYNQQMERLYEITQLDTEKSAEIKLLFHQEAREKKVITEYMGLKTGMKGGKNIGKHKEFPWIKVGPNSFDALIEGIDFKLTPTGKIIKL